MSRFTREIGVIGAQGANEWELPYLSSFSSIIPWSTEFPPLLWSCHPLTPARAGVACRIKKKSIREIPPEWCKIETTPLPLLFLALKFVHHSFFLLPPPPILSMISDFLKNPFVLRFAKTISQNPWTRCGYTIFFLQFESNSQFNKHHGRVWIFN